MAPITVDSAVLSGAGISVATAGDGLAAALGSLSGSINANTGYDAAGIAFGRQYVSAAGELLKAITSGVNACRNTGYGVQLSAANYSRAEAASDISGRSQGLSAPPCPAPMSAPGEPSSGGASVPPPFLWSVVQQFVGSAWPDGNPAELRSAAAAWRSIAGPLNNAGAEVSGARAPISGQRIDEGPLMTAQIDGLGTGLSSVASACTELAGSVEQYAARVEKTQEAIRDLCDRLGSIGGIVGTFFEFVKGHGLDEVHEIADEIKTVIAHFGSETDATLQLLESAKQSVDTWVLDLEKSAKKQFVEFFGEPVGAGLSSQFNSVADSAEGVFRWGTGFVEGIAALDPTRFASDPEGARQTWEGLDKFARLLSNPALQVLSDPRGSLETVKGLVHAEDWSKDRPMLGATEVGLDVASAVFPFTKAGALGKAGGASHVVEGTEESNTAIRAGSQAGGASPLSDITKNAAGVTEKLDGLAKEPISPTPPAGGRPVSLPGDAERGPTREVTQVQPAAGKAPETSPHPASTAQPPTREPVPAAGGTEKPQAVATGGAGKIPTAHGALADTPKPVESITAARDQGLTGIAKEKVGAAHVLDTSAHGPRPTEPPSGWSTAHESGHGAEPLRSHSGPTGAPTPQLRAAELHPGHEVPEPAAHGGQPHGANAHHGSEAASTHHHDTHDAQPSGHGDTSWDGPAGEHAAQSLPVDDSGYRIQPRDCDFLDISPEQVEAWANRQAPLGMTPAQFSEFRETLFDALQREGFRPEDVDVRLQGSSARFFSGEHKSLPLASDIHGNPEASARMEQWFGDDPDRPLRRPFDSMHRLGLETAPSDYDIQISSDAMTEASRRQWERDGSAGDFINPKYGFINKKTFREMFPSLREWAAYWKAQTGRPVEPALFPGLGPPDTSAAGVSSHFRESDWRIHPEGRQRQ
ncbi:MAG: hypothetical protein U0Q20_07610 [Mycobacterium sp.]